MNSCVYAQRGASTMQGLYILRRGKMNGFCFARSPFFEKKMTEGLQCHYACAFITFSHPRPLC
jgi:hypothetical protein